MCGRWREVRYRINDFIPSIGVRLDVLCREFLAELAKRAGDIGVNRLRCRIDLQDGTGQQSYAAGGLIKIAVGLRVLLMSDGWHTRADEL